MQNNNNPQVLTTEAGQQTLDQFLVENSIPCTADCIIEELNTDTCNIGLFNANSISIQPGYEGVMIEGREGVTFIDENNNRLYMRMSYFGSEELVGFTRYASQDEYGSASFWIRRPAMEQSGGEDAVFQIGLNIASMVEFGTNGINDEYRLAREQAEELEREMRGE
tara:strand:- start:1314 stop:1811 length:498 start_codon:yes stop_codon:yes gene_type:complete